MSRQQSERELKRFNRVLSGHSRDKDRQRWKRKVTGQAAPSAASKSLRAIREEVLADSAQEEEALALRDDEIQ